MAPALGDFGQAWGDHYLRPRRSDLKHHHQHHKNHYPDHHPDLHHDHQPMVQVVTGCCDGGSFINNAQHITMCGLFLCNGLADLAVRERLERDFIYHVSCLFYLHHIFMFRGNNN